MLVGQRAPDFTLKDADGESHRLSDLRGRPVVVFFYPRDDTPVCTREACLFRDHYEDFLTAGAVVIGISSDGAASHSAFAERHHLPFRLLCDVGGKVRKRFRVKRTLGIIPGRATFVVDAGGLVRHQFNSAGRPDRHVQQALEVVRSLAASSY